MRIYSKLLLIAFSIFSIRMFLYGIIRTDNLALGFSVSCVTIIFLLSILKNYNILYLQSRSEFESYPPTVSVYTF